MRATLMFSTIALGVALCGARDAGAAQPRQAVEVASQATDVSAQARRRPRVRIYRETDDRGVYPAYFPGANAVRDCSVRYVQEFRPSGTVIVPRMNCFWRQP